MNKIALRLMFSMAVAVSLMAKYKAISARNELTGGFQISQIIATEIGANGLQILENPSKPPKVLSSVVYFQRMNCSRRSIVMPLTFNVDMVSMLARVAPPDYTRIYAYHGLEWPSQNRVVVFLEWLKQSMLSLFDANSYVPVKTAIVIAEPPECNKNPSIDWRKIWARPGHQSAFASRSQSVAQP